MARLPPVERALITLAFEDLTHLQIAETTGMSVGNVGVRLHRIRKKLAEELAEEKRI